MTKRTDAMEITTRRHAAENGLRVYWTGRPCVRGHSEPRYTASGSCSACSKNYYQTAAAVRTSNLASRRGLVGFKVFTHAEDQTMVEDFVKAVVLARELSGPTVTVELGGDQVTGHATVAAVTPDRAAWLAQERESRIQRG